MIYVHIPFCKSFCTYCGFYSEKIPGVHCGKEGEREAFVRFCEAVCSEIAVRSDEIRASSACNTLYIGGGTPSVLPLDCLERIVSAAESASGNDFSEFTMEMNPDDVVRSGTGYAEALLKLGVNRASIGVQSFSDAVLKKMNRRHDAEAAVKAYNILEKAGFVNISVDLIFGLPSWFTGDASPDADNDRLKRDIDRLLLISSSGAVPKHISAYQLSVEPDSALDIIMRRDRTLKEASQEQCAAQYELICSSLQAAGYHHYEISNFAQPGYEAVHNSAYWSYKPYVGVGPAAHSFCLVDPDGYIRKWNAADISLWEDSVMSETSDFEILTSEQVAEEKIMLGLRTSKGIEYEYLTSYGDTAAMERALSDGHLVMESGSVRIPEKHFFISDNIISSLFRS